MLSESKLLFSLKCEGNLAMGLWQLMRNSFDVVLPDLSLPDSQGLATFTKVHDLVSHVPIIILTGLDDEDTAVTAMQLGAQDYLFKDTTNSNVLVRSIRYARERHGLVAALSQQATELAAQNMALDEFAHTLAHQVQGILGQIIGYASYAEMYHTDELSEEMHQVLTHVLKGGHKMSNILNELLLLASVRQSEVELVPLNMARVVQEVRKRLIYQIERVQGRITLPSVWPEALGHSAWIEEVWMNYISNGLKYGGEKPHLTLGADRQTKEMITFWNGRNVWRGGGCRESGGCRKHLLVYTAHS